MINRRAFLQALATVTASLVVSGRVSAEPKGVTTQSDRLGALLPLRRLGKTGKSITLLGLGGWHLGAMSNANAERTIDLSLEGGVRFFDCAESYHARRSQKLLGKFLNKHRDLVWLMTKTTASSAAVAKRHLDEALLDMQTDYLDLWQIHAIDDAQDVDRRIANGVLDVFLEAKAQGKVRHIGFTGHTRPAAHSHMLDLDKQRGGVLETCQMPVNIIDPSYESFITNVLPRLVEGNYGVLAMKSLGGGTFLGRPFAHKTLKGTAVPDRVSLKDAMHFALSMPVACLISGPDTPEQFAQTIRITREFQGMDEAYRKTLIDKVADLADNNIEWYKA